MIISVKSSSRTYKVFVNRPQAYPYRKKESQ